MFFKKMAFLFTPCLTQRCEDINSEDCTRAVEDVAADIIHSLREVRSFANFI